MAVKNKIVLITGSTRGIGKATAEVLFQAGAKVVLHSRNENKLQQALSRFQQDPTRILGVTADIRNSREVRNLVAQIHSTWGSVDILINNAGTAKFSPILETGEADWDEMQQVNLKGVFLCTRAVLPDMIKNRSGHIVTITSVAAKKAFPNCAAYGSSKAGALAFMNVLREEVRQYGIRVTSILAGATDTPLWDSIVGDFPRNKMMSPGAVARTVLSALQNRNGAVEEILIRPPGGDL